MKENLGIIIIAIILIWLFGKFIVGTLFTIFAIVIGIVGVGLLLSRILK